MDAGIYLAVFYLSRGRTITVGRLGRFHFRRGYYLYVGSAQKNLQARLDRHARRHKPLRWHIDYLSTHAPMQGALMLGGGGKDLECKLAALVGRRCPIAAEGFGASDCGCPGHLFFCCSR